MSKRSRTLEIEEDLQFQQKEDFFQRIGVALLFVFVVAAPAPCTLPVSTQRR